jgi:hypothetical protein
MDVLYDNREPVFSKEKQESKKWRQDTDDALNYFHSNKEVTGYVIW